MTIATLTATGTTTAKRIRHHGQGPYWHCRHGYGDKGKARKATKARPIYDNKNNGMARMCMMVIMQQPQARSVHSHDDVSKDRTGPDTGLHPRVWPGCATRAGPAPRATKTVSRTIARPVSWLDALGRGMSQLKKQRPSKMAGVVMMLMERSLK